MDGQGRRVGIEAMKSYYLIKSHFYEVRIRIIVAIDSGDVFIYFITVKHILKQEME